MKIEYALWSDEKPKSTFHIHRISDNLCVSQITTWGADTEEILNDVLTYRSVAEIVKFEESHHG